VKPSSARTLLGLAVVLYGLWVAGLATMAAISAALPGARQPRSTSAAPASPGAGQSVED
jgi:hypothetical protein